MFRKLIWFFTPFWVKRKLIKKGGRTKGGIVNVVKYYANKVDDEIDWINAW